MPLAHAAYIFCQFDLQIRADNDRSFDIFGGGGALLWFPAAASGDFKPFAAAAAAALAAVAAATFFVGSKTSVKSTESTNEWVMLIFCEFRIF